MHATVCAAIQQQWHTVPNGTLLSTPSERSSFTFDEVTDDAVRITTSGGTSIEIRRAAFEATLSYLRENGRNASNPCEIRSNKAYTEAGPLCRAARDANQPNSGGTMVITYVLPILQAMGLVTIDEKVPTTAWAI